jgi:ABC-type transport system substrate-binding protein
MGSFMADVKFTFDRLLYKSPGKSDFIAVDQVIPDGKHTVKITTKAPLGAPSSLRRILGVDGERNGRED